MASSTRLNELPLFEACHLIRAGEISPRDLLTDCISQIEQREDELGAFTTFDKNLVFDQLNAIEKLKPNNSLYGIPVGIKDIMETAGMRTTMGSKIYRDYIPGRDAVAVANLKAAGAIIAGKTESTEFAYYYPGKTRNPYSPQHTPGGSSMGSVAAVSQMMVPAATGTQTAGSVIRPAAYCGVIGYKASHGAFSLSGVCGFAPSLDSMGFFTRDVRDLSIIRNSLLGVPDKPAARINANRIGLVRTPHWERAEQSQRDLIEGLCDYLADQSFELKDIAVGPSDGALTEAQISIMAYEGCRSLAAEYASSPELMSEQIKALIELGHKTSFADYRQAIALTKTWQQKLPQIFSEVDVLLTPSAPGEAPKGLDSTGDPIFNRMWTLLQVPCIHLPVSFGPNGLPLGVQLVGPFNQDDALIEISNRIAAAVREFPNGHPSE